MSGATKQPQECSFRPKRPLVIGLLGGIASGKSTVARIFENLGLEVLDADREARRVTGEPEVRKALAARFGDDVLTSHGELDRAKMANIAFTEPDAKRDLEAIIHPRVRAALLAGIETASAAGKSVLLDVPLLLENGLIESCDVCVFVESSQAARHARAAERGWATEEITRREANQAALTVKKGHCAYIIRNDGPLEDTGGQVEALLRKIESS